ncbi:MAG: hypothetical protein MK108_12200 [Mariniblastus sp.]|nr:hypothetical protein [Mariniblastus sp.]
MSNDGKTIDGVVPAKRNGDRPSPDLLSWGQPRFYLLLVPVVAQLVTIWITWSLWQVRVSPPNLPLLELGGFQMSFTWTLMAATGMVLWFPRVGIWFQLVVLLLAVGLDQFRFVPQVFFLWLLMAAVVFEPVARLTRWYLASFWIWTGLHKLLSADWLGYRSFDLLTASNVGLEPGDFYLVFAWAIGLSEVLLGLLACFRPRWAACGCAALHLGIALFLSPLFIDSNSSVVPWNLATAIVGYWVLSQAARAPSVSRAELAAFILFMLIPCGFYFGWANRTVAHVLYSENIPHGYITHHQEPNELVRGWQGTAVPFPNERNVLRQYFSLTAKPGEKLHIRDPRPWLLDQFWLRTKTGLVELGEQDFLEASPQSPAGILLDDPRSLFELSQAGVKMRKKNADSMVFAVVFPPGNFDSSLLDQLVGLKNVEQVQLSGTSVTDEDLRKLAAFPKLTGVGLDHTAVTDTGIGYLAGLKNLRLIQYEGTAITEEAVDRLTEPAEDQ